VKAQSKTSPVRWLAEHPVQAALRVLFLILQLGLNSLFFVSLLWGPFNLSYSGAFLLGTALGAGITALWGRQQLAVIQGKQTAAKKFLWMGLSIPALVVIFGSAAYVHLSALGNFSPLGETYTEAFDDLWMLMDRHYPFFERKDVDWEAAYQQYRPQAAAAQTDQEFYQAVDQLLNVLPDGHTDLVRPPVTFAGLHTFGYAGEFQGDALVIGVSSTAEAAGLEVGDRLLEINGKTIPEALQDWKETIPPSSTPEHFQKRIYLHLLSTFDEKIKIQFQKPEGGVEIAVLRWDPQNRREQGPSPVITSQQLPSGVGVIRIRSFNLNHGPALIQAFDAALNDFLDAPGVILDVRNNGGGFSVLADLTAGRFFSETIIYGEEYYRSRLPQHFWRKSRTYRVVPRGDIYAGPVAVLTNPFTFSSADTFVAAMTRADRAVTVGRPTAGATGNPIKVRLPGGGTARFSTGDFQLPGGVSLEGTGIEPDIPVEWTREDLIQGKDPDVAAAEAYLLSIED